MSVLSRLRDLLGSVTSGDATIIDVHDELSNIVGDIEHNDIDLIDVFDEDVDNF